MRGILGWRATGLNPAWTYVELQKWIRPDSVRPCAKSAPSPAATPTAPRTEQPLRSPREIWESRCASDLERAVVLLAAMRRMDVPSRPLLVEDPPARPAVLVEVDLPEATVDARYAGRRILDPACSWCGFGDLRPRLYGNAAIALDGGGLVRITLPATDASMNRLEHRATVEMSQPRRVGSPMTPGGRASPDTAGVSPTASYWVHQEIFLTGSMRGRRFPTAQGIPLSMGMIRLGQDPPDLARGEGRSGQMCRLADAEGAYRIADAVVDPLLFLPDAVGRDSVRLSFPFEVTTVLTVPLRPSWRLLDAPDSVTFQRPGLSFRLRVDRKDEVYVRTLHLRVEKIDFAGASMREYEELREMVRSCSGKIGRIMP